jgi:hypothetical protein
MEKTSEKKFPENTEIKKTMEEALEVIKKYPKEITEIEKTNDGLIDITEKDDDIKKAIIEAEKVIEEKYKKAA